MKRIWDSGKVRSSQSVHISYQGRPLASREMCYWKVRVWDQEDSPGPWSQHAWWEMGLLSELDWHARWICAQRKPVNDEGLEALHSYSQFPGGFPAPMFRKSFTVDKKPIKARAYISGLGYYELQLNGEKVGDTVLDPAVSVYDKTVHYQTTISQTSCRWARMQLACSSGTAGITASQLRCGTLPKHRGGTM